MSGRKELIKRSGYCLKRNGEDMLLLKIHEIIGGLAVDERHHAYAKTGFFRAEDGHEFISTGGREYFQRNSFQASRTGLFFLREKR